ncbi:unnamed protein product [Rotaria sordida]|uniref:MULE transposase domain-containing protein n=1 Tax=Rotaria sordida TaxID=392033 RepID=A0A819IKT4_9BILA|nr:unnamed protein product [Rotaria sordida]
MSETTSITKIYDEEIAKAYLSEEVAAALPTVIEYRSNMSKAQRKKTPVIPTSCIFEIPTFYQQTLAQKRFLLMDFFLKRGAERVIVYSTDQQMHLLFSNKTIFIDGTFSTAPNGFNQVFLIHVQEFGQGVPVAFCLLPNRRAATYIELFRRFKHEATLMNKQFQPQHVVSDFESALISAIRQEFPGADYAQVSAIRQQCKQLMALSLMPIYQVEQQFKRIRDTSSSSLDDLFVYFDHQWINGTIPLSMWNSYGLDHRTNNISEAYNRRFATRISKKHPNIWSFIQLIQNENVPLEHLIIQLAAGASCSKPTARTTAFQRRFQTLKSRFDNGEIEGKQL